MFARSFVQTGLGAPGGGSFRKRGDGWDSFHGNAWPILGYLFGAIVEASGTLDLFKPSWLLTGIADLKNMCTNKIGEFVQKKVNKRNYFDAHIIQVNNFAQKEKKLGRRSWWDSNPLNRGVCDGLSTLSTTRPRGRRNSQRNLVHL